MTDPAESSGLLSRVRIFPCHTMLRRLVKADLHSSPVRSAFEPFRPILNTYRNPNQWLGSVPTSITTQGCRRMATHVLANISSGFPVLLTDKGSNT